MGASNDTNRYARQTILPEIGITGQEKISRASILCIGAGGLGCPALLYLAAAGIGRIGIVDFDMIDETNLHRQILFTMSDIGRNKAIAAKERLHAINPSIIIESHPIQLSKKNAERLFADYDLIIDGTDNFSAKFLINDVAVKCGKPFIYGSVLGFEGQVSVFGTPDGPCYRCLFPEAPKSHIPNCAEAGVIGAVAGVIGTAQAIEAIKIIAKNKNLTPLSGKLWTLDTRTMSNRLLSLAKNPDCPLCSQRKEDIMIKTTPLFCAPVAEITPEETRQNKTAILIDVREQDEWDAGHIDTAKLVPLSGLAQGQMPDLPKDCEIIIHCQRGKRGVQAAQILKENGYTNVSNMCGGYEAWLKC